MEEIVKGLGDGVSDDTVVVGEWEKGEDRKKKNLSLSLSIFAQKGTIRKSRGGERRMSIETWT